MSTAVQPIAATEKPGRSADEETLAVSLEPKQSSLAPQPPRNLFAKALIVLCLASALFFDIFNATSAISALPKMGADLGFSASALQWVLSAYTLTYGAFQVPSGRLSDVYGPNPVFCAGFLIMGICSILCGVSQHYIMLLVFRAVAGIGAAMTVPPSVSLIVQIFSNPEEQRIVLGFYACFGALGNMVGVLVGGAIATETTWRWIFYVTAIVTIPLAIAAWFFLPKVQPIAAEKRSLDLPGIGVLTAGLILFVYALSDGNDAGWSSARVLSTLIISIFLFFVFFAVERYVKDPAVPPSTWSNKNFIPLFFFTWSVYWFFFAAQLSIVQLWQDQFHWSALKASIHAIPFGAAATFGSVITGLWGHLVPRKVLLIGGQLLMLGGAILFVYGSESPDHYWPYCFPAMILGLLGVSTTYVGSTIAIMEGVRQGEQGVVSGVMYTAYQVGATIGIAITTSIASGTSKELGPDGQPDITGYQSSFWSLVGMHGIVILIVIFFVRR